MIDRPLSISAMKNLLAQLKDLRATPPTGWTVTPDESNVSIIEAVLEGPEASPFENGRFKVRLLIPEDFPYSPPKGRFVTKIFHPNIAVDGDICVNVLKRDWTSSTTIRHVLMIIRCLLIEPFPESALNDEAAKLEMEDFEAYVAQARMWTSVHAVERAPETPERAVQAKKKRRAMRRL